MYQVLNVLFTRVQVSIYKRISTYEQIRNSVDALSQFVWSKILIGANTVVDT